MGKLAKARRPVSFIPNPLRRSGWYGAESMAPASSAMQYFNSANRLAFVSASR